MRRERLHPLIVLALLAAAGCDVRDSARRVYYATTHKVVGVQSENMLPTVGPGHHAAVDTDYYSENPVRRFDLVVVKSPPSELNPELGEIFVLKRVVGLGGETVNIIRGNVYIDDVPLEEPFAKIRDREDENFGPLKIPEGEYFFMGDNRPNSLDSRHWHKHTLGEDRLMGKVVEVFKE